METRLSKLNGELESREERRIVKQPTLQELVGQLVPAMSGHLEMVKKAIGTSQVEVRIVEYYTIEETRYE